MTDPTGLSFISYRRSRVDEAALIVGAQRDRGIPTWQDMADLGSGLTEDELRRVLSDPETAGAVVLVTPEVVSSPMIREVEVPLILERHLRNDGFSAVVVAAGGLNYGDLNSVLGPHVGAAYMASWNVWKVAHDPMNEHDAAGIADLMLEHRLGAIANQVSSAGPLKLLVSTRCPIMKKIGWTLALDLTHRFDGRTAKAGAWEKHILPGLRSLRIALQKRMAGREVRCSGQLCLPAAVALGTEFLSASGVRGSWLQDTTTFGGSQELWGLHVPTAHTSFSPQLTAARPDETSLALMVSVTHDVVDDVRSSFPSDFPFRALVHIHDPRVRQKGRVQLSAGEAVEVAHLAVNSLRRASTTYKVRGTVHLFLAVPAGLAFMIGQLLNAFGAVQTYEHLPGQHPCYVPAAVLRPAS